MKKRNIVIFIVAAVVIVIAVLVLTNLNKKDLLANLVSSPTSASTSPTSSVETQGPATSIAKSSTGSVDSDKDGIPDIAEKTLGTDPNNMDTDGDGVNDLQDKDPAFAENPIKNDSTKEGFKITSILVENNVDPNTQKAVDDHLEIALKNISGQDLKNFEIYYTITDTVTNKKEGYYLKLTNFVLKKEETQSIHFDNGKGENHFSENPNSSYFNSPNAKIFDVVLSVPGYKLVTARVNKDPGGEEKAD